MLTEKAARWFKTNFASQINKAIIGTPYSLDFLTAIALKETGYIWFSLIEKISLNEILYLCVGDTIDKPGRNAFPVDKAELIAYPNGAAMFEVARQALEAVAIHNASYQKVATNRPSAFCRGYGIFQYDLQFFKIDPDYFLNCQWQDFSICLRKLLVELDSKKAKLYGLDKTSLSDKELIYIGIAYNCGHANLDEGFKQGYKEDEGYYGELLYKLLKISQSV